MFSVQLCITRYLAVVFCSRLYRLYRARVVLLIGWTATGCKLQPDCGIKKLVKIKTQLNLLHEITHCFLSNQQNQSGSENSLTLHSVYIHLFGINVVVYSVNIGGHSTWCIYISFSIKVLLGIRVNMCQFDVNHVQI